MAYYNTCPYCGSNLDPGETCDCRMAKGETAQEAPQAEKKQEEPKTKSKAA